MLQLINKKKIYFYIFLLFFLTSILNYEIFDKYNNIFLINNIEIKTNKNSLNNKILSDINYIKNKNIFYIDYNDLQKKIKNLRVLENIKIKKKLPSTIIVYADQTDLIAITYINQKKYFVGANKKFIEFNEFQNTRNLPIIFGEFDIRNFVSLKKNLSINNINLSSINKYFYHKNERWDLFFENNILVKLPNKNIQKSLKIYNEFTTRQNIKPNSVIDLRIPNRLILLNE